MRPSTTTSLLWTVTRPVALPPIPLPPHLLYQWYIKYSKLKILLLAYIPNSLQRFHALSMSTNRIIKRVSATYVIISELTPAQACMKHKSGRAHLPQSSVSCSSATCWASKSALFIMVENTVFYGVLLCVV